MKILRFIRRISLFTVSLDVPRPSRRTSYQVTCYKVKYRSVPRRFRKLGDYIKLHLQFVKIASDICSNISKLTMINFLCTSNQHKNPVETGLNGPVGYGPDTASIVQLHLKNEIAYIKLHIATDNIPPFFC